MTMDMDRMDADLLQAELYRQGARESRLRRQGICTHGWTQGQPGGLDGPVKCLHCGAMFANRQAHMDARREALA
jgi:hypothetical protein